MIVASGRSQRHVGAIADQLLKRLKEEGVREARVEGMPQCDWVLIDAGDVIVHVFRPEVRAFYNFGPQRPVSANVELDHGQFYNGHRTALTMARGRLQLRPQVSLEPGVTVNHVTLPSGNFTSVLATTRGTITVTPRLSASALFQLNTTTKTLNSNIRFRWEYRPGSELFVVYNEQRDTRLSGFPDLANKAFIVKVNRLFRF